MICGSSEFTSISAAKSHDEIIDRSRGRIFVFRPDVIEDFVAAHDLAPTIDQKLEQRELPCE